MPSSRSRYEVPYPFFCLFLFFCVFLFCLTDDSYPVIHILYVSNELWVNAGGVASVLTGMRVRWCHAGI